MNEMESYHKEFEARWADMDMNGHLRHSIYNDYAAHTRVGLFSAFGFPIQKLSKLGVGPILFREETTFFKEVLLEEVLTVYCAVHKMKKDGSRWSMLHRMYKDGGGTKAAEIIVDGAWLDLDKRKLVEPPGELIEVSMNFPRSDEFKWLD